MTDIQLISLLESGQSLNYEQIEEGTALFEVDCRHNCELLQYFRSFYNAVVEKTGTFHQNRLHKCNQKYILFAEKDREAKKKYIQWLYTKEIEYFFSVNCYSESMRYIHRLMNYKFVADYTLIRVLSYALLILEKSDMSDESLPYVGKLRALYDEGRFARDDAVLVIAGLMEAYAMLRMPDEYFFFYTKLLPYVDGEIPIAESLRISLRLHVLKCVAKTNSGEITSNECIEELCGILDSNELDSTIVEDYSLLLIPIFRKLIGVLPQERLTEYALKMIAKASSMSDKIDFFEFLIGDLKLDKQEHSDIYTDYYMILRENYREAVCAHRQQIASELMNFDNEKKQAKSAEQALSDELTGMGNRRAYEAEKALIGQGPVKDELTVVAIDLNSLKETNDGYGHAAGDELLVIVSEAIKDSFDKIGHVYRVGGDEFTIIAHASEARVGVAIDKLKKRVSQKTCTSGIIPSYALGFAGTGSSPGASFDELVQLADRRMYADKKEYYLSCGKDRRHRSDEQE